MFAGFLNASLHPEEAEALCFRFTGESFNSQAPPLPRPCLAVFQLSGLLLRRFR